MDIDGSWIELTIYRIEFYFSFMVLEMYDYLLNKNKSRKRIRKGEEERRIEKNGEEKKRIEWKRKEKKREEKRKEVKNI